MQKYSHVKGKQMPIYQMQHHTLDNFRLGLSHTAISLPQNVVAAKMEYTRTVLSGLAKISKNGA